MPMMAMADSATSTVKTSMAMPMSEPMAMARNPMGAPPPPPMAAATLAKGPESNAFAAAPPAGGSSLKMRSNFEPTAYFLGSLELNSAETIVSFKLPDAVDTYVVRAYVAAADGKYGQSESEIVSRTSLNLQPVLPTIVRLGDVFQAGVTVMTTIDDTIASIRVAGEVGADSSSLTLVGSNGKELKDVAPQVVKESVFTFRANTLGISSVTFSASGSCSNPQSCPLQDGITKTIPVLGQQDPVFVATSMAIRATEAGLVWDEGLKLPAAAAGAGIVNISTGVGRLPAVMGVVSRLVELPERPSAYNLLDLLLSVTALHEYPAARSTALYKSAVSAAASAGSLLKKFTLNSKLAPYSPEYYDASSPYIDAELQAYAVYAVSKYNSYKSAGLAPLDVQNELAVWMQALTNELLARAAQAREVKINGLQGKFSDLNLLARTYWAIYTFRQTVDVNDLSVGGDDDLKFARLTDDFDKLALETRAIVSMMLPAQHALVQRLVQDLQSQLRPIGRTAALRDASLYSTASALGLILLSPVSSPNLDTLAGSNPLLEKFANGLADSKSGFWYGTNAAWTAVALAAYDKSRGNTQASLSLKVQNGDSELMSASFSTSDGSPKTTTKSWGDLNEQQPVQFTAKGSGEVSVALGMSFTPKTVNLDAQYRGLHVEKAVYRWDGQKQTGLPIMACDVGETLLVVIQVTTPDAVNAVELVDLVPGGFEPVDPNVMKGPSIPLPSDQPFVQPVYGGSVGVGPRPIPMPMKPMMPVQGDAMPMPSMMARPGISVMPPQNPYIGGWRMPPWWGGFANRQTKADRVQWYADRLPQGSTSIMYLARATIRGTPPLRYLVRRVNLQHFGAHGVSTLLARYLHDAAGQGAAAAAARGDGAEQRRQVPHF